MQPRIALALLLFLPASAAAQEDEAALPALVRIFATRGDMTVAGTGFVVGLCGDKATIVTAAQVVEKAEQATIYFAADPNESFVVSFVGEKKKLLWKEEGPNGLAALEVRGGLPAGVIPLSFEIDSPPRLGAELYLLGSRKTELMPRTVHRTLSGRNGTLLAVDQACLEGFFGGPVLQENKVVGVVVNKDEETTYAVNAVVALEALKGWRLPNCKPSRPREGACIPGEESIEDGITYVRICPGTFTMGSAASDALASEEEKPQHRVTLTEFWLAKTEMNNQQYRGFRAKRQGEDQLPVTGVSWAEAEETCKHFGGRLPTEAEWEYAARAGSPSDWSFGDDETQLGEYAWYAENSGVVAHPVGMKRPNAWGLFDMHGNVWEWVEDRKGEYQPGDQFDPHGPGPKKTGDEIEDRKNDAMFPRVLRGGAYSLPSGYLRSAVRNGRNAESADKSSGFRCAHSPRREP